MAFSPVLACRLEEPVQVLQPLKVKDIPEIKTSKPEGLNELINRMVKQAKASSGIIWNSFEELEQDELTRDSLGASQQQAALLVGGSTWISPWSEWLEPLPDGFLEMIRGRGRIVKWAPQQEVLARPAIGGF
ncbi:hypothetical protein GH714_036515 [Hevea brasiliensis]|uniref:Uncharacterized protein n=1 Tax=Hevea brasiliensis TaxID=3981 RepID=A0A6A6L6D7_HEVBR|nr:hypothetical protein GH714_036515 [Hevea brasiliensis]